MDNKQVEFKVGQTFDTEYPKEAAIWCSKNGCKIVKVEKANYKYIIQKKENHNFTQEELLVMKEQEYGMNRLMRECILGNPKAFSTFNVQRAKEVENMAVAYRKSKNLK